MTKAIEVSAGDKPAPVPPEFVPDIEPYHIMRREVFEQLIANSGVRQ